MQVLSWKDFVERGVLKDTEIALTVGVFDGVHIGHKILIKKIVNDLPHLIPVIITFRDNPSTILHPENHTGDILTLEGRIEKFRELGVGKVILIDFSSNFSKLSGEDFFNIILNNTKLRYVVLGANFRCGENAATSAYDVRDFLKGRGVKTEIIKPVKIDEILVSSTRIRNKIKEGKINTVEKLIGEKFFIELNSNREDCFNSERIFIKREEIKQLMPDRGVFDITLMDKHNSTLDSRLIISEEGIEWFQPENFKTKKIIFK